MFHQIMQAGSMRPNEESIAIPESETVEQDEPQPNSPERTTTVDNTEEVTDKTEPQPPESPRMDEPATVEREEPIEPGRPTQGDINTMESPTEHVQDMEPRNDAPTNTTPSPDQDIGAEPNIQDILEEE